MAALRKSRWRKTDQTERDAESANRDAAQARLVTIKAPYAYSDYGEHRAVARTRNGSSLPVMDVKIVSLRNEDAHR